MKLVDLVIAVFVVASIAYISVSYIKLPDENLYNAMSFKASTFRDLNLLREFKKSISVLLITKDYKRLILGKEFRRTESIDLKSVISPCRSFGGEIEYTSTFPDCAGTIYAKDWSISFQPVTGYMNIKTNKR